jgi:tetratricopeptide (TPR) repeat protein
MTLSYNRRYDDALAAKRAAESIQPGFTGGCIITYYFEKGLREEHIAYRKKLCGNDPECLELIEKGLAQGGMKGCGVLSGTPGWQVMASPAKIHARNIADRYFWAGEHDKAVEWLWKAYEDTRPPYALLQPALLNTTACTPTPAIGNS